MKSNKYKTMLQEYKKLLLNGRVVEANKLRFEITMKLMNGEI